MYYIVTGAAGFIGANLVKALNDRGENNIIAVDNLKNADKFRNLADCDIADYHHKEEFFSKLEEGFFDWPHHGGTAPGRLLRHHGKRWPLHDEEQLPLCAGAAQLLPE